MLFKGIIMKCSAQIQEERTVNAIYHLLRGKKSIQTVQDAHLYELTQFYGVYVSLDKVYFDQTIDWLMKHEFMSPITKTSCKPTPKALNWLAENQDEQQFSYFNGLAYHEIDDVFLERLLLLIQVLTNRQMNHSSFIPIVEKYPVTTWMKHFYQRIKTDIHGCLQAMYQELNLLLQHVKECEAAMFVDRLTGYQHYGMSIYQLADRYESSTEKVNLLFTRIIHHMLRLMQQTPSDYPLLTQMMSDVQNKGFLTVSAHKTYQLIKSKYTIEEIAHIRHLKVHTIYDHIVEISLYDKNFSIKPYVGKQEQIEIIKAIKGTRTSKLKEIKDKVSHDITYFQIRLVLTFFKGDKNESI